MKEQKKIRVIFDQNAESVFSDILKNNGFEESDEDFFNELDKDVESKAKIIRDATITIANGLIPEKNLIELLQKHLKAPEYTIKKIVEDIKNKLLPLLLIYPDEKFNDKVFREEISKKVFGIEDGKSEIESETKELIEKIMTNKNNPISTINKKPSEIQDYNGIKKNDSELAHLKITPITNVEKNAENMEKEGKNITTQEKNKFSKKNEDSKTPEEETKPDPYKEPIE